jgi:Retron-type reverse transcriptase
MGEQFDRAASLTELCKGIRECKRNVSRKTGVMDAYIHALSFARDIRDDVLSGKYKLRPGKVVKIYRPKYREAVAPWFRDRVWQRSMCNNGVYDNLTGSFVFDNMACQKGKGLDLAIRRVIGYLQRLYRKDPNAPIYGKHLDIRKYFPSTPHEEIKALDREKITEPMFLPYLDEIIDSVHDPRLQEEIEADTFGERGTGLGSQVNQLHQIALLDKLDHELKTFCRFYIRYNDDFLILDHDRSVIDRAERLIQSTLTSKGLTMVDKAGTFVVQKTGFYFLRKKFILTDTGKIVIRMHGNAMREEREALAGMKRLLDRGEITMEQVEQHYQSWVAGAEYCGDAPIRAMDAYYTRTFRCKPNYKRKRRYLYGIRKKRKRTPPRSGERESAASGAAGESDG